METQPTLRELRERGHAFGKELQSGFFQEVIPYGDAIPDVVTDRITDRMIKDWHAEEARLKTDGVLGKGIKVWRRGFMAGKAECAAIVLKKYAR